MREKMVVHLHEPKTGGHACGAEVPLEFLSDRARRIRTGRVSRVYRVDKDGEILNLSEEYIGGEWCCTNNRCEVTCARCRRIMEKA